MQIDDSYRHIIKKHSGNKEENIQIPITDAYFEHIADVVENYGGIDAVPSKTLSKRIIYNKTYPDGTVMYVEGQRTGRKELVLFPYGKRRTPISPTLILQRRRRFRI